MNRREEMLRLRFEERMTLIEIGELFNISHQRVQQIIGCSTRWALDKLPTRKMTIHEKVWSKIHRNNPDECWEWLGSRLPTGYGKVNYMHKIHYTHRLVYEYINGEIPEGMHVLHTCDNPPCCNPSHLWLGTHQDNMRDRDEKGNCYFRSKEFKKSFKPLRGEKSPMSKLTKKQALEIKKLHATGDYSFPELGAKYKISRSQAYRIVNGKSWSHL